MARRIPFASLAAALGLLASTGCLDLDEQSLVHDLRILAIKTEPPELLLDSSYALGVLGGGLGGPGGPGPGLLLPEAEGFEVDIEIFAYDPREGLVSMTSFLCPDGVDSTCVDYDADEEALANVEDEDELAEREALFKPSVNVVEIPDTTVDPIGRLPFSMLTWNMTPSVISALTANEFGSAAVGVETIEPRIVVELASTATGGVNYASAFKRIPMIWDLHDPALESLVLPAIRPYDVELCSVDQPAFEEEGRAPCARVREPNRNPVLLGFDIVDEVAEAEEDADSGEERPPVRESLEPQLGPNPTLLVEPGGVLSIRPVFAPGSIEKYQVIVNDASLLETPGEASTYVEDRVEDFAANWFVTRGSVEFQTEGWTSGIGPPGQPDIASLDGRWQLPTASELAGIEQEEEGLFNFGPPPGANNDDNVDVPQTRDALVVVIKDQRGGTAVGQITVEYQR